MKKEISTKVWKTISKDKCKHISQIKKMKEPGKKTCEACSEQKDLRICMTCGHVGCCESSNAHNTQHFKKTGHPLIKPYRCDYDWLWCYKCNAFLE